MDVKIHHSEARYGRLVFIGIAYVENCSKLLSKQTEAGILTMK